MRRPPIRRPCCPLAPEIWLYSWPEEGGPRLSAPLRPGDPLPRPTHHRCLWRGQMQSGERERAGSSNQKDQQRPSVNVTEEQKTHTNGQCGRCWWRPRALAGIESRKARNGDRERWNQSVGAGRGGAVEGRRDRPTVSFERLIPLRFMFAGDTQSPVARRNAVSRSLPRGQAISSPRLRRGTACTCEFA
jgi:hypothetical protein